MMHALTIAWAAAAALVLMAFGVSIWPQRKVPSITAILLAIGLQACLTYYALGSDGVTRLLRLLIQG